MSRLIIRAEAEADIAEAARWYEDRVPGLGWEFVLEIRAAIRRAGQGERCLGWRSHPGA